jgi:hypothetical protein
MLTRLLASLILEKGRSNEANTMEVEGVVHNGVIVPDDATALPEGARVRISPAPAEKPKTFGDQHESSSPPAPEPSFEVPCGILRSQQAFWRDLPELLKNKRNHGKWACYHRDERVGIGTHEQLIRACIQRGIPDDAFHLDLIEAQSVPPWEDVEVERLHPAAFEEPRNHEDT